MIVHIAISTGWTIDYVEWDLDLPRLRTLNKYWKRYPPIQVMIAGYMGYKEKTEDTVVIDNSMQNQQMEEFMANVPRYEFQPPVMKNGD